MARRHHAIATPSLTATASARLLKALSKDKTTFGAMRCGHVDDDLLLEPIRTPSEAQVRTAIKPNERAPTTGKRLKYPGVHFETGSTSGPSCSLLTTDTVA